MDDNIIVILIGIFLIVTLICIIIAAVWINDFYDTNYISRVNLYEEADKVHAENTIRYGDMTDEQKNNNVAIGTHEFNSQISEHGKDEHAIPKSSFIEQEATKCNNKKIYAASPWITGKEVPERSECFLAQYAKSIETIDGNDVVTKWDNPEILHWDGEQWKSQSCSMPPPDRWAYIYDQQYSKKDTFVPNKPFTDMSKTELDAWHRAEALMWDGEYAEDDIPPHKGSLT